MNDDDDTELGGSNDSYWPVVAWMVGLLLVAWMYL